MYLTLQTEATMMDIQAKLNEEEDAETRQGVLPLHAMSASQFLVVGLDLEDQQCVSNFFTDETC